MRIVLLCLWAALPILGQERIAWEQTPTVFAGRQVMVQLLDGNQVQGRWISVSPEGLQFDVEKTSKGARIGKGLQTIARDSIARVQVRKKRIGGRVIGTLGGFYAAVAIGGAATGSREAMQGPTAFVALGSAIAGYWLGRAYDRSLDEVILF